MSIVDRQKTLVAGNWKMNNSLNEARSLVSGITSHLEKDPELYKNAEFLICPSPLHVSNITEILDGVPVHVGGQDCSFENNGAHTGDVSAEMLKDVGCRYVVLGHSERRQEHSESSVLVAQKSIAAHAQGLIAVICVGETLDERESGKAFDVVARQLQESIPSTANAENIVIAYEPVWAIGTGKVASPDDVEKMHAFIADALKEKLDNGLTIRILYGGSVKPDNANALSKIDHVGGFLIGGASLNADSYIGIARALA